MLFHALKYMISGVNLGDNSKFWGPWPCVQIQTKIAHHHRFPTKKTFGKYSLLITSDKRNSCTAGQSFTASQVQGSWAHHCIYTHFSLKISGKAGLSVVLSGQISRSEQTCYFEISNTQ